MVLNNPKLAKCDDRNVLPKSNKKYGNPDIWFDTSLLEKNRLYGCTFDFFIDWSQNKCGNEIWIKKIVNSNCSYQHLKKNYSEILLESVGARNIDGIYKLCLKYNIKLKFLLFKDDQNWHSEKSSVLFLEISSMNGKKIKAEINEVSIIELKKIIKEKSGGPIKIGRKGLIYGTSRLECYLSKTDSLYPGDVDMLIYNSDFDIQCIIEFKKHNLNSPISEQRLENYYPYPDGRKYNRLQLIKEKLGMNIPILILYYPTKPDIKEGRLELIDGTQNNLKSIVASNFSLDDLQLNHSSLIKKVLKASTYYQGL